MTKRKTPASERPRPGTTRSHDTPATFADAVESMEDVKPLDRSNLGERLPPTNSQARSSAENTHDSAREQASTRGPDGDAVVPRRAKRSEMRRLRAGKIRPQQTVDLHGFNRDDAHRRLCNAVTRAESAGIRCLLVVHGKGQRSEGGHAVLRQALEHWIEQPPLSRWVTGCCLAQPRDGGGGASYLLLQPREGCSKR